jgi:hypothetical protein
MSSQKPDASIQLFKPGHVIRFKNVIEAGAGTGFGLILDD